MYSCKYLTWLCPVINAIFAPTPKIIIFKDLDSMRYYLTNKYNELNIVWMPHLNDLYQQLS